MQFDTDLQNLLSDAAKNLNVELDNSMLQNFAEYSQILKEWNKVMNLTAIEDDRDIIIKHFVDSISIVQYIKNVKGTQSLIDIGTGAGFPGLPIKITNSNIDVTLMDSLEKRIKFLNEVINKLNMKGIRTVHSRAEDGGKNPEFREKYDTACARAVASLPVLLEYCLPFVKVGGVFIAMKANSEDEVNQSKKALELLGSKIENVKEFVLPFSDIKRSVIIVRKLRQTPPKYPRKAGKPAKEPLI